MAKYKFQYREHIKDDMYKTESAEVELTDSEKNSINSDDEKYSKTSSLLSSKLGKNVQALYFPSEIKDSNRKVKKEVKSNTPKKSFWRPIWAIPFKLIWRLVKMILPF
jgi:hypothetical protein